LSTADNRVRTSIVMALTGNELGSEIVSDKMSTLNMFLIARDLD